MSSGPSTSLVHGCCWSCLEVLYDMFKRGGKILPGTTKPPKRIHMEAMREPKASMKPMNSHTLAPAQQHDTQDGITPLQRRNCLFFFYNLT